MSKNNNPKIHILLVEDDEFMQAVLDEILNVNYRIDIRPDGLSALAFLQGGNIPDLIISDLNTPNMNGLELIEQLKVSDFFSSLPIMILSGEESSDKRIKCLDAGADDFVVKPFNPAELEARIKMVLRRAGKGAI
ncbi:response regulator receiver domain-containing protein [Pedobacter psychrotolerans]|uniref:Response regulator receiver domain-containing protein n=1 Tax=Pedobacter psychrotolerans TaxID=1843235 RepID=A0A4R2H8C3_9SPHI|nr:response regulator transcription factor [Pedobacter psychrotolerans]TCO20685.1 response regulator receiver domain-containing protein [Pedobacter psychrotolerans]GGE67304.1 two-component system response regulator [Pedobacter psychrotolerans]